MISRYWLLIFMCSHLFSLGQGEQLKFNKIIFRDKLENEFFLRRDTFWDEPSIAYSVISTNLFGRIFI
jgi:hypothetical protein